MSIITTKASSGLLRKSKHFIPYLLWFWRETHWVKISSGPSSLHLPCLGIKGNFWRKKGLFSWHARIVFFLCKNSRNWRSAWLNNLCKVTWIRPNWRLTKVKISEVCVPPSPRAGRRLAMGEARWVIKTGRRLYPEEVLPYFIFHTLVLGRWSRHQIVRGSEQRCAKEFGLDREGNEKFVALDIRSGMMKEVFPGD